MFEESILMILHLAMGLMRQESASLTYSLLLQAHVVEREGFTGQRLRS